MPVLKKLNLIVAAILSVLAASCVNEINSDQAKEMTRRYTLSFEDQTKTAISGTGSKRSVNWIAGDQIKYYTESNQSNPASADVTINGSSAYVEIPRGRTDEFINAVYGATQLNSSSSTDNCMCVSSPVKSNQRFTSFAEAHVCVAFSDDLEEPNLQFHNAACIVSFTSAADVHKVVFSGNNGEIIHGGANGDLKISCGSGWTLTVEPAYGGQTSVTIATDGEELNFYFAILPVYFSDGITVDCYDADGDLFVSKRTSGALNTVSSTGAPKILDLGKAQDWIASAPPVAIDLGLSVKWASCNVGASSPEEYGDYFSWGETAPKNEYKWSNYLYSSSKNGPFSKYVLDIGYGTVDHKTILDLGDDAAAVNWKDDWRLPSKEEFAELMEDCTWTWTTKNGVNGYKIIGTNGNSIFLPANGMRSGSSLSDEGTVGNYWSSSISHEGTYYSISPYFSQSYRKIGNCYRYFGLGVRPVYAAVIPVSSVEIPATLELLAGKISTLTATISPDNATYRNVTWSSSDESVATVDNNGQATAVTIGYATITAYSADASKTATCEVTVCQLVQSITLNHTELEMYVGDSPVTLVATVLPNEYTMKDLTWSSTNPSVAKVDSEGNVSAVSKGLTMVTARANDGSNVSAECKVTVKINLSKPDSVEAVDLGLPSGLKWATCNVGAIKPEEYGEYFAWGETEPKENYNWYTYKWCRYDGKFSYPTKYCDQAGFWGGSGSPDNKTVLDAEDDTASANWGGSWRMPTDADWWELSNNCTWTWTDNYNGTGIKGFIGTSNKVGYTEKSIFFPAAGYRDDSDLASFSLGYYWSSSLYRGSRGNPRCAIYASNTSGMGGGYIWEARCRGLSVRPVSE